MSDFQKLQKALVYCVTQHAGVFRDGEAAVPYACHPVEVMLTLRFSAGVTDENLLVAALLHDTVEDTSSTIEEIDKVFGPEVAEIVAHVTRAEPDESETAGKSKEEVWLLRTKLLLDEIAAMPREGLLIKLSDRLSNIKESELTRSGYKLERYRRQTVWLLQAIPRATQPFLWDSIAAILKMDEAAIESAERFPG